MRRITTHQSHPLNIQYINKSPLPIVYHHKYSVEPWPETHTFRMPKFKLLYQHLKECDFNFDNLHQPELPTNDDIAIVHDMEYIKSLQSGNAPTYKSANLIYSEWLLERCKLSCNGTLLASKLALEHGIGVQLSGGYHHSFKDHGSGFCILNDLAYSSLHLISNKESNGIRNICILDFDVHQGDGTASILQSVDNILTVSAHCDSNYPFVKQQSDIDLALEDNLDDVTYLHKIDDLLKYLVRQKHKNNFPIDLIIYDGGVDVHKNDHLGRLNITDQGIIERDRLVFEMCINYDIPIAAVVGGGYDKSDTILAERHGFLHWQALQIWNKYNLK